MQGGPSQWSKDHARGQTDTYCKACRDERREQARAPRHATVWILLEGEATRICERCHYRMQRQEARARGETW